MRNESTVVLEIGKPASPASARSGQMSPEAGQRLQAALSQRGVNAELVPVAGPCGEWEREMNWRKIVSASEELAARRGSRNLPDSVRHLR